MHEFFHLAWQAMRHLNPNTVGQFAAYVGPWLYVALFAVVFCETGVVVWPFLPGDSLLFTLGAVAALPQSQVNLPLAIVLLCVAANCGDLLNYLIGRRLGPVVFKGESTWLLNRRHLLEAQDFYQRHGRKTIILARFVPIVRTFAPLVAGIGRMPLSRFIGFSVTGGILWVVLLSVAGFWFGSNPFVQKHYELIIWGIVFISLLPPLIHVVTNRRAPVARADATS